jgi:hypothetical protein
MRRQDKIQKHEQRERLRKHNFLVEDEHGWAGQRGQHPETEEEENYRPAHDSSTVENDNL